MTFEDVLEQVLELLQQEKRVSYRGIQRRVSLDEAYLADLKEELLFAHPEIADVDRRGLAWNDEPPGCGTGQRSRAIPSTRELHPATPGRAHPRRASRAGSAGCHERRTQAALRGAGEPDRVPPNLKLLVSMLRRITQWLGSKACLMKTSLTTFRF